MKALVLCGFIVVFGLFAMVGSRLGSVEKKVDIAIDKVNYRGNENTYWLCEIWKRVDTLESTLQAFRGATTRRWKKEDSQGRSEETMRPKASNDSGTFLEVVPIKPTYPKKTPDLRCTEIAEGIVSCEL